MSLDPSQMTPPQIIAAVVSRKLRLVDAEAELGRRPGANERLPRTQAPPPRRAPSPSPRDVRTAIDETRSALKDARRTLAQLSTRLEGLEELAGTMRGAAPAPRPTLFNREIKVA